MRPSAISRLLPVFVTLAVAVIAVAWWRGVGAGTPVTVQALQEGDSSYAMPTEPKAPPHLKEGELWVPPLPNMEEVAPDPGWVTSGPHVPPMPLTLLRLPRTNITRARYSAIDFHFHGRDLLDTPADYERLIALMDEIGFGALVNLDAGRDRSALVDLQVGAPYRDRILHFPCLRREWERINEPGWSERIAAELERAFQAGAAGLKINKELGQGAKSPDGGFIQADDPRMDPIWEMCAKYGVPVMIHTSDSIGRFYPIGPKNERYEAGLWRMPGDTSGNLYESGPPHEVIERARENVHRKHPNTRFVWAHMAMLYYDPEKLAKFLDDFPNADVEMSAAFADLGRAPRLWREFLIKYQDRVLFGTDGNPAHMPDDFWTPHWRYMETFDEYFYHPAQVRTPGGSPGHGRWNIHGVGLPDNVLRKLYYENALRHLPHLRPSIERQLAERR